MLSARVALITSAVLVLVFWVNFFGVAFYTYRSSVLKAYQTRRSNGSNNEGRPVTKMSHMAICRNELSLLSEESNRTTFRLTQESVEAWKETVRRLPEEVSYWDLIMAELSLPTSTQKLCEELRNILGNNELEQQKDHAEMSTVTVVIERELDDTQPRTTSNLLFHPLVMQWREEIASFFMAVAGEGERPASLRGAAQSRLND